MTAAGAIAAAPYGCMPAAGAEPSSMLPQKRHLTAASWISSAQ